MRGSRLFIVAAVLIFVLIILRGGAVVEPRALDHEQCKESFLVYMLFNECTELCMNLGDGCRERAAYRGG